MCMNSVIIISVICDFYDPVFSFGGTVGIVYGIGG